jgi:adenylate cyclase
MGDERDSPPERGRMREAAARAAEAARRAEQSAGAVTAARFLRELLPGDSQFGDPLSTAGDRQTELAGRRLSALTAQRPGLMREAGLGALQVWQSFSESRGRGRGDRELAIVFTDLVGFSDWALEAGDDQAVELLRDVGAVLEPAVTRHGGEVVKRLGDGLMAVFESPSDALEAIAEARDDLQQVQVAGYRPRFRAGIHVGRPRKLGGDYFGVDVNIAARVAEQAGADELLVSDRALALLDEQRLDVRRKRRFKVSGVPSDLCAYRVSVGG